MSTVFFERLKLNLDDWLDHRDVERIASAIQAIAEQDSVDWVAMFNVLERIPAPDRLASVPIATCYAQALAGTGRTLALLEFADQAVTRFPAVQAADIFGLRAEALMAEHRYMDAKHALDAAMPHWSGVKLAKGQCRMGLVLFVLGETWEATMLEGLQQLSGRELGAGWHDYGYCLFHTGQSADAWTVWSRALPLLKGDALHLARLRLTMGHAALDEMDPNAERHVLEALRLARKPVASRVLPKVLNALGRSRRMLGEWGRALYLHRQALSVALEVSDKQHALALLVRTLRLIGRHSEVLEQLEEGALAFDVDLPFLQSNRVLSLLKLDRDTQAITHLERIRTPVHANDRWQVRLAHAELARRQGHPETVLDLLEGFPIHTLYAREEAQQWPDLFALLQQAGRAVPKLLMYAPGTTVQVSALGVLRVLVNGRAVPVAPISRAGEVLVFLLEQEGAASVEAIREALFPGLVDGAAIRRANKAISYHAGILRDALGWETSLVAQRGTYQLDPNVSWHYDVTEARASRRSARGFLKGVYSGWAVELGRELEDLHPGPPAP